MDLNLRGKKVLITGASQGIGEGLARAFAEEGCAVHLTARSDTLLSKIKDSIDQKCQVAITIQPVDMTTEGAIEEIVAATSGQFGKRGVVAALDVGNDAGAIEGAIRGPKGVGLGMVEIVVVGTHEIRAAAKDREV